MSGRYALEDGELANMLNSWGHIPESAERSAEILAVALRHVLEEADAYSDAMLAIGRGSTEFGSTTSSYSASWIAKRALDAYAEQRAWETRRKNGGKS